MSTEKAFHICVLPGDGIGVEVTAAAAAVLEATQTYSGGFALTLEHHVAGAGAYRETGIAMSDEAWRAAEDADAIFLGAMGLPDIRFDDGTEIAPQLDLRFKFNLYAGVRPVSAKRGGARMLSDPRAENIDFVLVRESTEGLFASRGKGEVLGDREARDTMVITRETSERLFAFAFDQARRRKASSHSNKVTLVDKSNVFVSMAFFRKVFDEVAGTNPDIDAERVYIDACALDFIRRPWDFDVVVTENMFGDILSDLAAGLVGGMGFAPSADIGDERAVFQPAHGSAPDIVGSGRANPTAAILSAAMMLDWLGHRHGVSQCLDAAKLIDKAVEEVFFDGQVRTYDMGGTSSTADLTDAVIEKIKGSQGK